MNVLIVEPGQAPREASIDNTLETLQKLVGGTIEAVYPYDDPVTLICNDEGKLMGLPLNRAMCDDSGQPYDILAGTFLVCGLTEQDFGSLTPELMEKYKEKFAQPESFLKMGDHMMVFRHPPKAEKQPKAPGHDKPKPGHDAR